MTSHNDAEITMAAVYAMRKTPNPERAARLLVGVHAAMATPRVCVEDAGVILSITRRYPEIGISFLAEMTIERRHALILRMAEAGATPLEVRLMMDM